MGRLCSSLTLTLDGVANCNKEVQKFRLHFLYFWYKTKQRRLKMTHVLQVDKSDEEQMNITCTQIQQA
jgi:hypothetical protein